MTTVPRGYYILPQLIPPTSLLAREQMASMTTHTPIRLHLFHIPHFYLTFSVGGKQAPLTVAIFELQYHLRVLGSFVKLRDGVTTTAVTVGDENDADACAIFLSRAVYHFHKWIIKPRPTVEGTLAPDSIPPSNFSWFGTPIVL